MAERKTTRLTKKDMAWDHELAIEIIEEVRAQTKKNAASKNSRSSRN